MKKILTSLACLLTYSIMSAAPVIYVVDMANVYRNYYKAKEAATQINSSVESTNKELRAMNDRKEAMTKEIQGIQEKLNNPALSEDAKKKIVEAEAQPKVAQLRQIEASMQEMRKQTTERLQQNAQQIRQVHMGEISQVIQKIAEDKKADFIVEKSTCYFSKPAVDISEEVITAINAGAPAASK